MKAVLVRLSAALVTLLFLWGMQAEAQTNSVDELAQRLQSADDFLVRTQAALALGASASSNAVGPLCAGLDDANTTVRAAAAAALGRLALGGRECLTKRLSREQTAEVKSVIERALSRLEPSQQIGPTTKYYVAIGEVTNKTSRSTESLDRKVRATLAKELGALPGFVIAPKGETEAQAKALLSKHKQVKGIFVWPKVEVVAQGRDLQVKLDLSLFSYPNKDFKGSLAQRVTSPDTSPTDVPTQDDLIDAASGALAPDLAKNASRI
jgi:hypothetical protein